MKTVKINSRLLKTVCTLALLATVPCSSIMAGTVAPWKFGVLSDTQWVTADDGKSPASIPAYEIQQVDKEFINKGVTVVVAVGDTMDSASAMSIKIRSLYAQELYNAGIGFYPVRGNHDAGLTQSGVNTANAYPQIITSGLNNQAHDSSYSVASLLATYTASGLASSYDTYGSLSATLNTGNPPVASNGLTFVAGTNFSLGSANGPGVQGGSTTGNGLSYSFDVNNARFVLLDTFTDTSLGGDTMTLDAQLPWVTSRLSKVQDPNRPMHAFVLAHKNLLGGNHKDNIFGAQPTSDPGDGTVTNTGGRQTDVDNFISLLHDNGVQYYIGGHDHHHHHALVKSPLNPSTEFVEQIIAQSDSNKFYTPANPFSANDVVIDDDLWEVGYYIYTVDGPRVTVDYYAVPTNLGGSNFTVTPVLTGNWNKLETIGYSLNGKQFTVAQGASYTSIADTTAVAQGTVFNGENNYVGTSLAILSGTNNSAKTTNTGRHLTKLVHTGWAPANGTVSDIATLWGLTEIGNYQTDTITVQIGFDGTNVTDPTSVVLATRVQAPGTNSGTIWINAVDANIVGGTKTFVNGSYGSGATGLGSYGVVLNGTQSYAWAVVNGDIRDYAVVNISAIPATLPWDLNGDGKVTTADSAIVQAKIRSGYNATYDFNNDGRVDSSDVTWLTHHYTNAGGK